MRWVTVTLLYLLLIEMSVINTSRFHGAYTAGLVFVGFGIGCLASKIIMKK